jgi:hypothetical protein
MSETETSIPQLLHRMAILDAAATDVSHDLDASRQWDAAFAALAATPAKSAADIYSKADTYRRLDAEGFDAIMLHALAVSIVSDIIRLP